MNTKHFVRPGLRPAAPAVLCGLGLGVAPADAQPPNYGHDFVTVGAPGNRPPNQVEAPQFHRPGFSPPGRVDYRYRITRTEVTVSQWFEFVVAYAPYWEGSPSHPQFTSDWVRYRQGTYSIIAGAENFSANMSWRNAARYVNWLCHGKRPEQWAFEDGAYDTSTFVPGPIIPQFPLDQEAHHAGAKFWIPTWDEYVKAIFYDPNRYGPGQEGYWQYPDSSDDPLVPGHPWQGGETNAGIANLYPGEYPVGSYPHVQSPWGLLDVSGGIREKTETLDDPLTKDRLAFGSYAGLTEPAIIDRIDVAQYGASPNSSSGGFRVASLLCYVDCDTSTGLEVLDVFDFLCFLNRFAANDIYACNCDISSGPALCDIFDFLCFQNAYDAGCP